MKELKEAIEEFKALVEDFYVTTADIVPKEEAQEVLEILQTSMCAPDNKPDNYGLYPQITSLEITFVVVKEMNLGRAAVLAVLLADAIHKGQMTLQEVEKRYGSDVSRILHGVERIRELYRKNPVVQSDNFRQLLLSFAEDMRVILIFIASRVCIMRNIKESENEAGRNQVSMESAYLYAPLAHKLGLYKIKSELEDLSLKYLEHDAYYHIKEKLNATKRTRDAYIDKFIAPVAERLESFGLKFHIKGRTKSIHSIWQKMQKQKCPFEGVYDLFAIRIIIDAPLEREKMDCWQAYSIIADMYQPNPKRMRDWLTIPKSNGYESLHITVLGPENKWVEVQIRTERMDDIAERGLAAHWRYKGVKDSEAEADRWLQNIRSALEVGDDMQLMDQFKMDLYEDEVFVFTPKGDLYKLPVGATVLDFAYAIHTKIGNKCTGARIGGKLVTLRQVLQSGDQVEILTQNNQVPKQDWLNVVKTTRAKSKIRQSLKEIASSQASLAKEELERKFKNRKIEVEESLLMQTMTALGYKVVTSFYQALAEGVIDANKVIDAYLEKRDGETNAKASAEGHRAEDFVLEKSGAETSSKSDVLMIDEHLKDVDYSLAKCCHPVYGDKVFGFLTAGGGVKIHRMDCPNAPLLRERYGYRIIDAKWAGKGGSKYAITLRVIGQDDLGIVNNISSIISKENHLMLRSISIDSQDGLFKGTLTIMLDNTSILNALITQLKNVKGVKDVERL